MAEELTLTKGIDKAGKYEEIIPQIKALIADESDLVANMANIAAVLKEAFDFFWVGFYVVKSQQLVLGPFQGPLACTRIDLGKGVCGTAWEQSKILLVEDVDKFPGHIACSSDSRSEIVVPIYKGNEVWGVLDVDSDRLRDFDQADSNGLERIMDLLSAKL